MDTPAGSVEEIEPRIMYFRYQGGMTVEGLEKIISARVALTVEKGYATKEFVDIFDLRFCYIKHIDVRGLANIALMEPIPDVSYFVPSADKAIMNNMAQMVLNFSKQNFIVAHSFDQALEQSRLRLRNMRFTS